MRSRAARRLHTIPAAPDRGQRNRSAPHRESRHAARGGPSASPLQHPLSSRSPLPRARGRAGCAPARPAPPARRRRGSRRPPGSVREPARPARRPRASAPRRSLRLTDSPWRPSTTPPTTSSPRRPRGLAPCAARPAELLWHGWHPAQCLSGPLRADEAGGRARGGIHGAGLSVSLTPIRRRRYRMKASCSTRLHPRCRPTRPGRRCADHSPDHGGLVVQ